MITVRIHPDCYHGCIGQNCGCGMLTGVMPGLDTRHSLIWAIQRLLTKIKL